MSKLIVAPEGPLAITEEHEGGTTLVYEGENATESRRQAQIATTKADAAAESANFAEEFSGPAYATVEDGEAATTAGQFFRVPIAETDPVEYTRYQRTADGSVEAAPLATTAALTSPDSGKGAALVVTESGETVQDALIRLATDAEITLTVGDGGDYATLNDALAEASTYRRKYKKNGERIEVQLLSGFVMAEQVHVISQDLSFVTITSEGDAEVTVTRSALTDEPDVPGWRTGTKALFAACQGAWLPVIGALFSMDDSGDGVGTCGVVIDQQSYAIVLPDCGVKNAGWRGLYGIGGFIYARNTIWDGAGLVATTIGGTESEGGGVRIANGGSGSVRGASAKNCAIGLYLGSSRVVAVDVDVSGAKVVSGLSNSGTGVYLISGIHALLSGMNAIGAERNALKMTLGATAWLSGGDLSGAGGSAIHMSGGSTLYATDIDASGAGIRVLDISGWSIAGILNSNLSDATERALTASSGSSVTAMGCDLTGAGDATPIRAFSTSKISLSSCSIDQAALSSVSSGSEISIYECVDGDSNPYVVKGNIPVNTFTRSGVLRGVAPTCREVGNSSVSIALSDPALIVLTVPISQARTCSLPAIGSVQHPLMRFVRTADATGAFDYSIQALSETIATLAPGEWVDVAPNADRTAYFVAGKGTLS